MDPVFMGTSVVEGESVDRTAAAVGKSDNDDGDTSAAVTAVAPVVERCWLMD
jgi:hypothetical protein